MLMSLKLNEGEGEGPCVAPGAGGECVGVMLEVGVEDMAVLVMVRSCWARGGARGLPLLRACCV